jgi:ABC-2 type transport system permease protein
MIGSLGQPLLFLVALGYGLGPVFQKSGEGNYLEFLAPGIVAMTILFASIFSGIEIIWDRQFGFLKETLVAPVPRINIMIGRTLGGATTAVLQGILVFLISLLVGFKPTNIIYLPLVLFTLFLIALLFTALGTAIASLLEDMQGFQMIMNFLIMPLFFLSGALFPLQNLPPAIATVVRLNPLTYGVDALRGLSIGVFHFGLLTDFTVLGLVTALLLIVGSYLFSKIQI